MQRKAKLNIWRKNPGGFKVTQTPKRRANCSRSADLMSKTSPVSNGILVQPSLFIRASRTARWPPALDGLSFSSSPCPFAVPLNAPCHRDASWTGHGGGQRARIGPCRDPREQDMGASEHVALESESREVVASLGPRLTPTPPVVFMC